MHLAAPTGAGVSPANLHNVSKRRPRLRSDTGPMALTAPTTVRADVLVGARAMAPFVLAFAPFALVIGSTVATLDNPVAGWAGSWLIFGGSAHLAAVRGIADGTAPPRPRWPGPP